jgi:hypothetical protein
LPIVSILRRTAFIAIDASNGSRGSCHFDMRSRSPPAQKSAFADVSTRPLTASSLSTRSTTCASAVISSSLTTFIGRPGKSIVATAMPSVPTSR